MIHRCWLAPAANPLRAERLRGGGQSGEGGGGGGGDGGGAVRTYGT